MLAEEISAEQARQLLDAEPPLQRPDNPFHEQVTVDKIENVDGAKGFPHTDLFIDHF